MRNESQTSLSESLLCDKGLAKREGLVVFVQGNLAETAEENTSESRSALRLRHDESVIRTVFNARYANIGLSEGTARQAEVFKREKLLRVVYRLYQAGRKCTPSELRRVIQNSEVELAIACLQRLSLMGNALDEELCVHVEREAAADPDLLAHVMDPFQLRFVLTIHRVGTRDRFGIEGINTLLSACRKRDQAAVRVSFENLVHDIESLPKDAPQFFRSLLLGLWRDGDGDLGMLAYQIAVLDSRLFQDLGWENSRTFFAQLRRVTGPGCEALDPFLSDEDIDGALLVAEELRQADLIAHFRKLAASYDTKLHVQLRRSVLYTASQPIKKAANPTRTPFSGINETRERQSAAFGNLAWSNG